MALVAFLKGINVGGHRRLRPTALARSLKRFEVVSIGAAGTFVARRAVARAELRDAIATRAPFEVEVMICHGREILRLLADDPFAGRPRGRDVVCFVGVMAKRRRSGFRCPSSIPPSRGWCVEVLACRGRFVLGTYRRRMKTISCFARLEEALGAPLAIRSWNTMLAVGNALGA